MCIYMSVIHTWVYMFVKYENTSPCNLRKHPPLHTYVCVYIYINIQKHTYISICLLYIHVDIRSSNSHTHACLRNQRTRPPLHTCKNVSISKCINIHICMYL